MPMDEAFTLPVRRRRRKSSWELFKEQYLPSLILLTAIAVVLALMLGAMTA